ncbi:hypothetical protein PHLCEN_2v8471 [Hermanssonia centrifuga]|uniref:Uncharacterized protein n=1 Tax=Hermanssonia centrifuga TaxID=98765 RepID=A0A2R6NTH6_9APHY|nr:hypothetical protein PHLCEN_2v8471 [Hermanssonia centrifuga]
MFPDIPRCVCPSPVVPSYRSIAHIPHLEKIYILSFFEAVTSNRPQIRSSNEGSSPPYVPNAYYLNTKPCTDHRITQQPPPAYYTIYPRTATPDAPRPGPAANTNQNKSAPQPKENLISRYRLENRLDSSAASSATEDPLKWDDSPEKREAGLRERKARMVLAARQ